MAQIFWEQIRNQLPSGGEYLTGSLTVSGSFGATGSIYYNGVLLEDLIGAGANTSTTYGTETVGGTIGIATSSAHFVDAVVKSGLFRQTGSVWATTNYLEITGSLAIDVTGSGKEFSILKDGEEKFKLTQDGVIQFVSQSSSPSAIAGGMYYDQTDEFYLGFQN